MVRHIDFSKDLTIVEFGPWIGTMTKQMLSKATPNTKIYAFEVKKAFVEELEKIQDPRLIIIHNGAEKIAEYLKEVRADIILSWLPFWSLPKELTAVVLKEAHRHLKPNGMYLQFQYLPLHRKQITSTFKNSKLYWQPLNFPPAFVYKCHKIHF